MGDLLGEEGELVAKLKEAPRQEGRWEEHEVEGRSAGVT
jgi:hypothetical protein